MGETNNGASSRALRMTEAAAAIGVSDSAIRQAVLNGSLPHKVEYGVKVIDPADLEAYRERTNGTGGRPSKRKAKA